MIIECCRWFNLKKKKIHIVLYILTFLIFVIPVPKLSVFININFLHLLSTEMTPLSTHLIHCQGESSHISFFLHFKMPIIVIYSISLMTAYWQNIKIHCIKCIYWLYDTSQYCKCLNENLCLLYDQRNTVFRNYPFI